MRIDAVCQVLEVQIGGGSGAQGGTRRDKAGHDFEECRQIVGY